MLYGQASVVDLVMEMAATFLGKGKVQRALTRLEKAAQLLAVVTVAARRVVDRPVGGFALTLSFGSHRPTGIGPQSTA